MASIKYCRFQENMIDEYERDGGVFDSGNGARSDLHSTRSMLSLFLNIAFTAVGHALFAPVPLVRLSAETKARSRP